MVEANVATLFQAAFIPGILAALGYIAVIAIVVRVNPAAGPAGDRATRTQKWAALLADERRPGRRSSRRSGWTYSH